MSDEPTDRRQRLADALADPTIDDAMRAELQRATDLYDVLATCLAPEAAERHAALVETLCVDTGAGVIPISTADRTAGTAFRDKANELVAAMAALPPTMLAPEAAAEVWAALNKANVMIGARLLTRPAKGRRSWHAVNVVAVARALWVRWRGEEPRRGYGSNDTDAFLDFLGDLFAVLDVRNPRGEAASPRGAVQAWAEVADAPELNHDFAD